MTSAYGLEILVDYVISERRAEADRERLATRARAVITPTREQLWPPVGAMRWLYRRVSRVLVGVIHGLRWPAHTRENAAIDGG